MSSTQSIRTIKTTCPYCGVGCGVKATVSASGAVRIAGDEDHPSNFGRLCSKGSALADVLVPEGRLRMPQIGGQDVSWDAALHAVASRFKAVIAEHGPDATAFYVSGQLLTEDYYIANKLMKGYIGSANIDTNSRLCMASSVAGHKRAFGEDIVPGTYEDFDHADLVVLTGSNFAWCHPVLHQRLMAAKAARPELMIVAIDPRKTATTQQADMHLDLAPGSDVALFQGLLRWLSDNGHDDSGFIAGHTQGLSKALAACDDFSIAQVARRTQLPAHTLAQFYALFAKTEKTVTVYSQGVNQAADGTDRVGAIINCHLFTGRIGRPGMGPFSITGQPNAMGGREVGGLANQLACHMDLENPQHRATARAFWGAPHMPGKAGLKAVDLFDAVASGKVKAIWIMATNPVDSLPNADKVRRALETCETVVVSDVTTDTDTAKLADILLPAMAWGEKNGTVTNSERRISRQRRLKNATGEARADWDIMCDVARRMGWSEAFDFSSEVEIFREYAAMTAFDNDGSRGLDLSALADVTAEAYDALEPVQWPVVKGKAPGGRLFENGGFYTPSRRANFIVPAQAAAQPRTLDLPFTLNTGRIRDQWHSMTRTGLSATLSQHLAEPFVEIHPEDARQAGIKDASLAEISSRTGSVIVRALVTPRQRRGSVFVPMHWTDQFASNGRVDALVAPQTDPFSGQPALKSTAVYVQPYAAQWHGFAVLRHQPQSLPGRYWAIAPVHGGWRLECAGQGALGQSYEAFLEAIRQGQQPIRYDDAQGGQHRAAIFAGDTLAAALFFSKTLVGVSRQWASSLLDPDRDEMPSSLHILAGRAASDQTDQGAIVCACMNVGINTIRAAAGRASDVDSIGACTGAGTNCGSCRGEIKQILEDLRADKNAIQTAVGG